MTALLAAEGSPMAQAAGRSAAKQRFSSAFGAELRGHAVYRLAQPGQILFDTQPDRAEVNAQVARHDHVAKPAQFAPTNLRLGALDLARTGCTGRSVPGSRACGSATPGPLRHRVSQQQGGCHHALAQRRVQACFGGHIHTAAHQLLCVQQQPAQGKGAGCWLLGPGSRAGQRRCCYCCCPDSSNQTPAHP